MTIGKPYCDLCGEDHARVQIKNLGTCDECFMRECHEALKPILGERWLQTMIAFIERRKMEVK